MIRKTTTFAELLVDCPYIQLEDSTSITAAMWLETRLLEKEIQLSSALHEAPVGEKEAWVSEYDKGYKAGRDGEAERVRELVNKFWGL